MESTQSLLKGVPMAQLPPRVFSGVKSCDNGARNKKEVSKTGPETSNPVPLATNVHRGSRTRKRKHDDAFVDGSDIIEDGIRYNQEQFALTVVVAKSKSKAKKMKAGILGNGRIMKKPTTERSVKASSSKTKSNRDTDKAGRYKTGKWSKVEHESFLHLLKETQGRTEKFGVDEMTMKKRNSTWTEIAKVIGTRSSVQVHSLNTHTSPSGVHSLLQTTS